MDANSDIIHQSVSPMDVEEAKIEAKPSSLEEKSASLPPPLVPVSISTTTPTEETKEIPKTEMEKEYEQMDELLKQLLRETDQSDWTPGQIDPLYKLRESNGKLRYYLQQRNKAQNEKISQFIDSLRPIFDGIWQDAIKKAAAVAHDKVEQWKYNAMCLKDANHMYTSTDVSFLLGVNSGEILSLDSPHLRPAWNKKNYTTILTEAYDRVLAPLSKSFNQGGDKDIVAAPDGSLHQVEYIDINNFEPNHGSGSGIRRTPKAMSAPGSFSGAASASSSNNGMVKIASGKYVKSLSGVGKYMTPPKKKRRIAPPVVSSPGCNICKGTDRMEALLLCDNNCGREYHYDCLVPPLEKVPEGIWLCPECLRMEYATNDSQFYLCSKENCGRLTASRYCARHRCPYPGCVKRIHSYNRCREHKGKAVPQRPPEPSPTPSQASVPEVELNGESEETKLKEESTNV